MSDHEGPDDAAENELPMTDPDAVAKADDEQEPEGKEALEDVDGLRLSTEDT